MEGQMSAEVTSSYPSTVMTPQASFLRHIPVVLALLAIGGIFALVSEQLALGPRSLIPGLIVVLVLLLLAAVRMGRLHLGRAVGLVILGVVTTAEAAGTLVLIAGLLTSTQRMNEMPHAMALILLRDAALIWVANILTFSLWYWELDGGGPARRHCAAYQSADFLFPQSSLAQSARVPWL